MKNIIITILVIALILLLYFIPSKKLLPEDTPTDMTAVSEIEDSTSDEIAVTESEYEPVQMENPASLNCIDAGGALEIVTNSDGSQFGMCNFEDYACEEWAYLRDECTLEEDAAKIKQALIAKGLTLTDMKVVINKHLGKYISGSVLPVSGDAGGGYVFAVKDNGKIKVLADGNGAIMCSYFDDYPDFPSYLIPECVDVSGQLMSR